MNFQSQITFTENPMILYYHYNIINSVRSVEYTCISFYFLRQFKFIFYTGT